MNRVSHAREDVEIDDYDYSGAPCTRVVSVERERLSVAERAWGFRAAVRAARAEQIAKAIDVDDVPW